MQKKANKHFRYIGGKTVRPLMEDCGVIRLGASNLHYGSCQSNLLCQTLAGVCFSPVHSITEEEQLPALELGIVDPGRGVDVLFRKLIQNRVFLLNTHNL